MRWLIYILFSLPITIQAQWIDTLIPTQIKQTKGFGSSDNFTFLSCFVGDPEVQFYVDPGQVSTHEVAPNCVGIYLETDYFTYQSFGNDTVLVISWMKRIFEVATPVYANEGINIYLASHHMAKSTAEDWSAGKGAVDILYAFGGVRGDTINGRLKHFITRRNLGGGVAWVGTLCMNVFQVAGGWAGPYAVSGNMIATIPDTESWTVSVFMHEMGHNFGSRHTQSCVWGPNRNMRIDDCVGAEGGPCDLITPIEYSTIMSYCHLTTHGISYAAGFGTFPGNLMRAVVSNSCVSYLPEIILNDNVTGTYRAETIILDDVQATNLTLYANVVEIQNSDIQPVFEVINLNCSE